jgi:bifunctional DNA-binding transcriptional regulator/antitoxin component of YhaV-PrlF toxin-antitoxin module
MPMVKVRGRGQVTIPLSLRKDLQLDDDATLTVVKAGKVLLMTPRSLQVDRLAKEAQRELKKRGLSVEDVLDDLKRQRARYNKDRYGA